MLDEPSCPRHSVRLRARDEGRGAARARDDRGGGPRPARRCTTRARSCRARFDSFRLVEEYAETGRAQRQRAAGRLRRGARRLRTEIEAAVRDQPGHEPVPAHNDLLPANFLRDGDRMQLIDWEYAGMGDRWFDLGNFAVNNELDEDQEDAAAGGLLRRGAGRPPARDAEAVPLHVGLPRGDVGRGAVGRLRARLRLPRVRAASTSTRLEKARADPRFEGWIEEARS